LKETARSDINSIVTPKPTDDCLVTRASLLDRLKDWGDQAGWQDFFDTYGQLIYRVSLKSGLTETEAQDAVQETVLAVVKNIGQFKYEPSRCSFKSWLMILTQQRIIWQLRKRIPTERPAESRDDSSRTATIERVPDEKGVNVETFWEHEWQANILSAALDRVKGQVSARQFQIFDLYALQNWSVAEVARILRVSTGQVYLAKHRVARLLKKEVGRLSTIL
jgi:RNA polymerase sigma factor (sigma-70 family)